MLLYVRSVLNLFFGAATAATAAAAAAAASGSALKI
jgi:hypothetical protein